MNAQLKKGLTDVCILQLIKNSGEVYGYDIMKKMRSFFPDVNESTFYAVMRRLNSGGYTAADVKASKEGPPRKYYSLTQEGVRLLSELAEELREIKAIMDALEIY